MSPLDVFSKKGRIDLLNQGVIDAFPFPIFIKDCDRRYILCNSAFYEFLKAKPKQIIGFTAKEISPPKNADTYKDADDQLFQNGGSQTYRAQVKDFVGETHYVEFRKALSTSSTGERLLIGSIIDLTALEESFERCHLLSDLASEAIFMHSEGLIEDCNSSAQAIFSLPKEAIVGKHLNEFVERRWFNYITHLCLNKKEERCELEMLRKRCDCAT
jgi:PAS domain-containing protein